MGATAQCEISTHSNKRMEMNKRYIAGIAFMAIFISACTSGPPQKLQTEDTRACAKNFTTEGNFFSGRIFKTNQFVSGINKNVAMDKIAQSIAKEGGVSIVSINKEIGVISASVTNSSMGENRTTPLSIIFEPNKNGVNIYLSFSVSGGQTTSGDEIKNDFCGLLSSVSKK